MDSKIMKELIWDSVDMLELKKDITETKMSTLIELINKTSEKKELDKLNRNLKKEEDYFSIVRELINFKKVKGI